MTLSRAHPPISIGFNQTFMLEIEVYGLESLLDKPPAPINLINRTYSDTFFENCAPQKLPASHCHPMVFSLLPEKLTRAHLSCLTLDLNRQAKNETYRFSKKKTKNYV